MINPKELMIGNYFLEDGKTKRVNSHTWDDSVFDHLFPIPLTPDILKKCGFEENDFVGNDGDDAYVYRNKKLEDFYFNSALKFYSDFINAPDIKFLHQLQNIFFALTGEELEVNL